MPFVIPAAKKRDIPGRRYLSIALRSLHILGVAGLAGGYLFSLPREQWLAFFWLAVVTGGAMIVKQLYVDNIWLLQLRGQLIIGKIILLGVAWQIHQGAEPWPYIVALLVSGFIAHAPGKVRYYSLWHRRKYTRDQL